MDHGSGYVGKGSQEIEIQLFVEIVVLGDRTQKQVLVYLIGVPVPEDCVVVYLC